MVKIIYCITKKPGMSEDEFHRYWKQTHGPIAARIPGLRRYVQSHTHPSSAKMWRSSFDGAAEVWFDDMASLEAALGSPEIAAAMDCPIGTVRSRIFRAREAIDKKLRPLIQETDPETEE